MYLFIVATMAVCSVTFGQTVKKPDKPDHYFLTKLGNDTLAVEEFSINSHEIQGTSIARAPRLTVRKYKATFGDNGMLEHFHVTYQRFSGQVSFGAGLYVHERQRLCREQTGYDDHEIFCGNFRASLSAFL